MTDEVKPDRFAYIREAAARKREAEMERVRSYQPKRAEVVEPGSRCLREENPAEHRYFDVSERLDQLFYEELQGPWRRQMGVYHPSSLSLDRCRRALYHDRIGTLPRPSHRSYLQSIFDEGHGTHGIIQERLRKGHVGFHDECRIDIPDLHITGSTDGVFDLEDWLLEIKTMGDASFSALVKPKKEHVWQLHPYMFARDIPRAQLLYVNRNNGRRRNFKIYFSVEIWNQIKQLVTEIEDHVARQDMPPKTNKVYECSSCKFQFYCFDTQQEATDA